MFFVKVAYSIFTLSSLILLFSADSTGKLIGIGYLISFIILNGIQYIVSDTSESGKIQQFV